MISESFVKTLSKLNSLCVNFTEWKIPENLINLKCTEAIVRSSSLKKCFEMLRKIHIKKTSSFLVSLVTLVKRNIILETVVLYNAQKMRFSIKDYFSKCDQIRRELRIWSYLLKKSSMKNFIFCALIEYLQATVSEYDHGDIILNIRITSPCCDSAISVLH